jgi:hypothetical protein
VLQTAGFFECPNVIINNLRTVLVDDVSNYGVKGQVHQAVTGSVGQEMFTERRVQLQE